MGERSLVTTLSIEAGSTALGSGAGLRTSSVDVVCFLDLRGEETGLAPIQRRTPCINLASLTYHLRVVFRRIPRLIHGVMPGHEGAFICIPCRLAKVKRQSRTETAK